ncbi:hypothetical protein KC354_g10163 [Hortaea werneckii]|nr:hypothetical protein KC354_g10163 [Hortaea werneckii]
MTATSTERITSTLPASTNTETFTQRTTEQTTVISYPPASTNTATQTEVSTLLTTQNVTQTLISNLPGTTVTTTSILLSSYPLTQTETTSLLVTSTHTRRLRTGTYVYQSNNDIRSLDHYKDEHHFRTDRNDNCTRCQHGFSASRDNDRTGDERGIWDNY